VNTAISRLEREVDLLREYRFRLTADVVTGKLDVRTEAQGLPDEAFPEQDGLGGTDILDEDKLPEEEEAA
jgi:type I restriction enzyme, S subunit